MSLTRPRLRRILGRLLLLAVPLILAFGAAELFLRITDAPESSQETTPAKDPRWLTVIPSAEVGWIFPADTTGTYKSSGRNTPVTTNSWGLRGSEVSTDTTAFRVLVLGDSYAFGWGMAAENGMVRLLESGVQQSFGDRPVEFINGSLPGYSIYQQIRMLEYVRQRTDIHAVVATISLANDPIDEKRIRRFVPDNLLDFSYEWRDPRSFSAKLIASSRVLTLIDGRTTTLQFSYINTNNECRDLASRVDDDPGGPLPRSGSTVGLGSGFPHPGSQAGRLLAAVPQRRHRPHAPALHGAGRATGRAHGRLEAGADGGPVAGRGLPAGRRPLDRGGA